MFSKLELHAARKVGKILNFDEGRATCTLPSHNNYKMVVFTNIENVRMSVKCRCKWTPQFFVFILAKQNHQQSVGVSVVQKFVPSVLPKKSHIDPHLYIFSSSFFGKITVCWNRQLIF